MRRWPRRPGPPSRDAELVEQLSDRPDLLVMADEVYRHLGGRLPPRRAGRVRRRRLALAVGGAAAAIVAGIVVVLLSPWGSDVRAGVLEEALAAVREGSVIHLVATGEVPGVSLVEIETGEESTVQLTREIWYDERSSTLKVTIRRGDQIIAELSQSPHRNPTAGERFDERVLPPPLVDLAVSYRAALADNRAMLVGEETVDGRRAYAVDYPAPAGGRERVYVDPNTHLPFAARQLSPTEPGPLERVQMLKAIPSEQADLTEPLPGPPLPVSGRLEQRRERRSPEEAAAAIGTHVLWPGQSIGGLPLVSAASLIAVSTYAKESERLPERTALLELLYGIQAGNGIDRSRPFVILRQAGRPSPAYGWEPGLPVPTAGTLEETDFGSFVRGKLAMSGLFITIEASNRALLLETARTLRPLTTKSA